MQAKTDKILSSHQAAGHAAWLSRAEFVPLVPGAQSIKTFHSAARYADCLSASDAAEMAAAAAAAGKRVFLPLNKIPAASMARLAEMRLPVVAFHLGPQKDALALRDAGWAIVFAAGNQEILDSIIRGYRVCEDSKVLLPMLVSIDHDIIEPVQLPGEQMVKNFLGTLKLPHRMDKKPMHAGFVDDASSVSAHTAEGMGNFMKTAKIVDEKWKEKFRRSWPAVEAHKAEDAELLLVMAGYHSATAKAAVDAVRASGKKAGLLRIRLFRPLPKIDHTTAGKKVAILDAWEPAGAKGALYTELRTQQSISVISQRYFTEKDFAAIFAKLEKAGPGSVVCL